MSVPAPVPTPSVDYFTASPVTHVPLGWIIGGLGVGFALIVLSLVVCMCLRSSSCFTESRRDCAKDHDGKTSHQFQILRKPGFCCASGRYICCKSANYKQTTGEASNPQITIPKCIDYSELVLVLKISFL